VPSSPQDDRFSDASFESYQSAQTPPKKVTQKYVEAEQILTSKNDTISVGRLNPDLHIRNATAYDRVIPQDNNEDSFHNEKREQAIARLLGSGEESLNSQVGDRLEKIEEQRNFFLRSLFHT
jgi:hypothetical protein